MGLRYPIALCNTQRYEDTQSHDARKVTRTQRVTRTYRDTRTYRYTKGMVPVKIGLLPRTGA